MKVTISALCLVSILTTPAFAEYGTIAELYTPNGVSDPNKLGNSAGLDARPCTFFVIKDFTTGVWGPWSGIVRSDAGYSDNFAQLLSARLGHAPISVWGANYPNAGTQAALCGTPIAALGFTD